MLNSAFDGDRRRARRLLPGSPAGRDRPSQRAGLRHRQQRGLPRRVRDHAGGLRRGGHRAVRHARLARGAAGPPALSDGRPDHRGRLAPVHHAPALRPGLSRPLQVQPAPAGRLPAICGPTRASSTSGRASPRPSTSRTSRATTTPAMPPSTRPASCPRGRCSTSPCPTAAKRCGRPPRVAWLLPPARRLRARERPARRCRRCRLPADARPGAAGRQLALPRPQPLSRPGRRR